MEKTTIELKKEMKQQANEEVLLEDERLLMQIRLFRMACSRWNKTTLECADIFDRNHVDEYISDCYELFHIQGDEANLEEIREYVNSRGEQI